MRMKLAGLALVAFSIAFAGVAAGQDDPITQRQQLMKSLGPYLRAIYQMVNGDAAFDAAAAEEGMQKVVEHAAILPTLFPEGSQDDSAASPLIWQEFDQFKAIYAQLGAAGEAGAKAAAANDLEGVSTAFEAVGAACGTCHEKYRLRR